ncbi:uncharacterized protein LOC134273604 [Saccostrea cucullata]|uniref:uncharacterized protein LOC134273604 n=1 Tax=Saccostrea cuccullata TaxID=36930 RepID=UPI002ED4AE2E
METAVKTFIRSIQAYCKPLSSPEYKDLERNLKRAAEKFDKKEELSKSEIINALTSYEDYLKKNFKDKGFQSATATVPYKTSRKKIIEASSPSPENATKERKGSSSSKRSNSEQGTNKEQRESSAAKRNGTNRVTRGDQKDRKTTPTPLTEEKRKAVLHKVNHKDGKATPPPKASAKKDAPKVEDKNPSRDSTSLESNDWKAKFEEKDKELNCLNEQVKLLAQEMELEGETAGKILTDAARELKSIKEQKNKEQTESLKELESNLERVKKAVFEVPKVKEKDHDLEKTITRIQDLHK